MAGTTNMPQYIELMKKIAAEDGEQLQQPCRPEQIVRLQAQAKTELNAILPLEYLDFLRFANGYIWNGLEIYACETAALEGVPNAKVMGLIDINLIRREVPGWDEHICLAECDDDSYGLRLEDGKFCGLEMVSGEVFEEYDSFDHMISSVLRQLLKALEDG